MPTLVIGVAGGSGSGKSSVARRVAESVRSSAVAFLEMDSYYRDFTHLPFEERKRINWDHPDAIDFPLFVDHLARLRRGEAIEKPVYDFTAHARSTDRTTVGPAEVAVVDGILLFADAKSRALCDIKVFVDADADVRLVRRVRRDIAKRGRSLDDVLDQYVKTVRPMHLQFVEPSKRHADVIIPRGGHNRVALDLISARIAQHLSRDRL